MDYSFFDSTYYGSTYRPPNEYDDESETPVTGKACGGDFFSGERKTIDNFQTCADGKLKQFVDYKKMIEADSTQYFTLPKELELQKSKFYGGTPHQRYQRYEDNDSFIDDDKIFIILIAVVFILIIQLLQKNHEITTLKYLLHKGNSFSSTPPI